MVLKYMYINTIFIVVKFQLNIFMAKKDKSKK